MQTQNLVWGVGGSRMSGTFVCFCHLLCNKHSAVCFYSSFGVQQNNTVVTSSRTIKLLLNTLLSLLLTEYKLISNCWAWESLEEYRKFIDILLGSSLVWWHLCKGSGQSSRNCVAAVDAFTDVIEYVLYIKEGKIISCVPLFPFLIHARACLLWLLFPVSDPGSSASLATPCEIAQAG